jgi:hypothetical protein
MLWIWLIKSYEGGGLPTLKGQSHIHYGIMHIGDEEFEIIETKPFEKKSYQTPEYLSTETESDIHRTNSV